MRSSVFVIEQDDTFRRFICESLSFVGIFCRPFSTCEGVLTKLAESRVSMIVLDVDFPNLEAFELLYEIKLRDPYLPILATSTKTTSLEHFNIPRTLPKNADRMRLIATTFDLLSKSRVSDRHKVLAP